MISHLSGKLAEKELTRAVIDVGGVGYEVAIPMSTFDRLPLIGEPVALKTQMHVREDAMVLYGFHSNLERDLFRMVTNVSGIGPKLGLSILSCMAVERFCSAIVSSDIKAISGIQGIGKRSAERLCVELKDKIDAIAPAVSLSGGKIGEDALSKDAEDAVSGLVTLGFKQDQARKAVRALLEELPRSQQSAQNLIRKALASMSK